MWYNKDRLYAQAFYKNSEVTTYADDTILFLLGSFLDEVEGKLKHDLQYLKFWLDENELYAKLKKGKTKSMVLAQLNDQVKQRIRR